MASSASAQELEVLLKAAHVDDLLRERTTMDDAGESNSAPAVVEVALKKSGLPTGAAVMIGDSPYDIASAKQIGGGTIALRCGGFTDDDLTSARAIDDDPADLLAHYDASPLREASRPVGPAVRGEQKTDTEEGASEGRTLEDDRRERERRHPVSRETQHAPAGPCSPGAIPR